MLFLSRKSTKEGWIVLINNKTDFRCLPSPFIYSRLVYPQPFSCHIERDSIARKISNIKALE